MKIKCDHCGEWIDSENKFCPNCGTAVQCEEHSSTKPIKIEVPTTIDELKEWAAQNNLPLEDMRTYIGIDYKGAKAFGIYQDEYSGEFIVYKNKANGTRAIRYQGSDEAYAVKELYLKMKERVAEQKSHRKTSSVYIPTNKLNKSKLLGMIIAIWVICLTSIFGIFHLSRKLSQSPSRGYYKYNDTSYYYDSHDWYEWYGSDWYPISYEYDWMNDGYDDYYDSYYYNSSSGYYNFEDSDYYTTYDDDDDYDSWDSDSDWDSSFDDWDSDW